MLLTSASFSILKCLVLLFVYLIFKESSKFLFEFFYLNINSALIAIMLNQILQRLYTTEEYNFCTDYPSFPGYLHHNV